LILSLTQVAPLQNFALLLLEAALDIPPCAAASVSLSAFPQLELFFYLGLIAVV